MLKLSETLQDTALKIIRKWRVRRKTGFAQKGGVLRCWTLVLKSISLSARPNISLSLSASGWHDDFNKGIINWQADAVQKQGLSGPLRMPNLLQWETWINAAPSWWNYVPSWHFCRYLTWKINSCRTSPTRDRQTWVRWSHKRYILIGCRPFKNKSSCYRLQSEYICTSN